MAYAFNDDKTKCDLLNFIYPVGSIYLSVNSTDPSTLFGGTWVAWGTGRCPIAVDPSQAEFNVSEKIGGEKSHKLTINEMPLHRHYTTFGSILISRPSSSDYGAYASSGQTGIYGKADVRSDAQGNDQAHNNLQPYITCYMWKRIA